MILICIDTKEVIFLTQCWCGTASVLWRKNKYLWFASWTLLPPRRVVSPLVKWSLDHHQCFAGPPGRARWDHGFNQLMTFYSSWKSWTWWTWWTCYSEDELGSKETFWEWAQNQCHVNHSWFYFLLTFVPFVFQPCFVSGFLERINFPPILRSIGPLLI